MLLCTFAYCMSFGFFQNLYSTPQEEQKKVVCSEAIQLELITRFFFLVQKQFSLIFYFFRHLKNIENDVVAFLFVPFFTQYLQSLQMNREYFTFLYTIKIWALCLLNID